MHTLQIRCVQMVIENDVHWNIQTALEMAQSVSLESVDVLIFPELFTTGYQLERASELAHTVDDPSLTPFYELAQSNCTYVILGSILSRHENLFFNETIVINPEGEILSSYQKIHLFRLMEEEKHLSAGHGLHSFEIDGTILSSIICYDLRFPEITRKLYVDHQPAVVFVPMEWPHPRTQVFRSLMIGRALENQCFMVACNRVGADAQGVRFEGSSMVVDPYGNITAERGNSAGLLDAELDLSLVEKVRTHIPCYTDRRPDLY